MKNVIFKQTALLTWIKRLQDPQSFTLRRVRLLQMVKQAFTTVIFYLVILWQMNWQVPLIGKINII